MFPAHAVIGPRFRVTGEGFPSLQLMIEGVQEDTHGPVMQICPDGQLLELLDELVGGVLDVLLVDEPDDELYVDVVVVIDVVVLVDVPVDVPLVKVDVLVAVHVLVKVCVLGQVPKQQSMHSSPVIAAPLSGVPPSIESETELEVDVNVSVLLE